MRRATASAESAATSGISVQRAMMLFEEDTQIRRPGPVRRTP